MTHSPQATALTELILEIFRTNGQLLAVGDELTHPLGLTSARWQVLGAIDIAAQPMTVAQIGRRMGLSRQSVQRIANDLEEFGFITFEDNPDHARAKLLVPTSKGDDALTQIGITQTRWSNALAEGMETEQLTQAASLLRDIQKRCDSTGTSAFQNEAKNDS
jgi:DNA-binding MarR family transcriptional regulator